MSGRFKLTILWNGLTPKLIFGIKIFQIAVHSVETELGSIDPASKLSFSIA